MSTYQQNSYPNSAVNHNQSTMESEAHKQYMASMRRRAPPPRFRFDLYMSALSKFPQDNNGHNILTHMRYHFSSHMRHLFHLKMKKKCKDFLKSKLILKTTVTPLLSESLHDVCVLVLKVLNDTIKLNFV